MSKLNERSVEVWHSTTYRYAKFWRCATTYLFGISVHNLVYQFVLKNKYYQNILWKKNNTRTGNKPRVTRHFTRTHVMDVKYTQTQGNNFLNKQIIVLWRESVSIDSQIKMHILLSYYCTTRLEITITRTRMLFAFSLQSYT